MSYIIYIIYMRIGEKKAEPAFKTDNFKKIQNRDFRNMLPKNYNNIVNYYSLHQSWDDINL